MVRIRRNEDTTWNKMRATYNAVWMVDFNACRLTMDGKIAKGSDILEEDFHLPPFLINIQQEGVAVSMLMLYNPTFFEPSQYIFLETSQMNDD